MRRLVCEGELKRTDMNVAQYLAEATDKETGWATVEVQTIADRIGYSRPTVVRSLKRLIEAGVIERKARRKGNRCLASAYKLPDLGSLENLPRFTDEPTPVHGRTTYARGLKTPSHDLNPHGLSRGREPPDKLSGGLPAQVPSNGPPTPAPTELTGPPRFAQQDATGANSAPKPSGTVQENRHGESPRPRGSQLTQGWEPDRATLDWARREGFCDEEIGRELAKFKDSARAHGRIYNDWNAALRSWFHHVPDFSPP